MKKDSEKMKNKKVKAYFWIAIPLALVLLAFVLVTHRPKNYAPLRIADQNQISTYLTHQLMPTIYNNSQLDEPFRYITPCILNCRE